MIDLKYYASIVSFEHKLKACICLKRAKSQMLSLNNSNNLLTKVNDLSFQKYKEYMHWI